MKVLHVAAECQPLLKTGGLADVIGALPAAQRALGIDARILLPGYDAILDGLRPLRPLAVLAGHLGIAQLILLHGTLANGTPVFVIDAPAYFHRRGGPYADGQQPYPDNHLRFALLGWAAAQIAAGALPDWQPDVLHAHDWHAGLAPVYLRPLCNGHSRTPPRTIFTIHNLAYQGLFPADHLTALALSPSDFHMDALEFHGQLSFIKGGLCYSDWLTTVSPSYAQEIQTPTFGCGLHGLLHARRRALFGILNGINDEWAPDIDPRIAQRYDQDHLAGKATNKRALQSELGLAVDASPPLFGVVSRLTAQKGLHRLLDGATALLARGGPIAVLGSGDAALEDGLRQLAQAHPGQVAAHLGFHEKLAHQLIAGADVILVPSRFEPCGLTQLYALRYGSLPLVRRTGGLADTVVDCSLENLADGSATGFVFERDSQADFDAAVRRAYTLHADPARWQRVQQQGMRLRFDWHTAAKQYVQLYAAPAPEQQAAP